MAKRVTAPRPGTKQPEWQTEICDTCRFSEWITDDHRHRDLNGNPICLRCPHYEFTLSEVVGRVLNGRKEQSNEQRTIIADVRRNPATTGFAC